MSRIRIPTSYATALAWATSVLCITAIGWLIAQQRGDTAKWTAVAATASVVQTMGVIGALLYARRQIQLSRELARQDRLNRLLDRTAEHYFGEVQPRLLDLRGALVGLRTITRVATRREERGLPHGQTEQSLERADERVNVTASRLNAATAALHIYARQLGLAMERISFNAPWWSYEDAPDSIEDAFTNFESRVAEPLMAVGDRIQALVEDQAPLNLVTDPERAAPPKRGRWRNR